MSEPAYEPLSWEDRHAAGVVYETLLVLRAFHPRLSPSQIKTFLHVALDEGLTVSELAKKCGVKPVAISRRLQDLGPPIETDNRAKG